MDKRRAHILHTIFIIALWGCTAYAATPAPSIAAKTIVAPTGNILRIVTPPLEKTAQAHDIYFIQLLRLALQKTEATDGPFSIEQYGEYFTGKRFLAELTRDESMINVLWTMNDKKREEELLPIKISLLHGLGSYRIFLIRKDDQYKFRKIQTLKELSQYTAGLGSAWPDTPIMQSNGLPVITSAHYELLFTMLAGKRFDYFPRGLHEIWDEQRVHADRDFAIEDSIMLHYSAPTYFFVNKNNVALAKRIERGLNLAIEDGSFDQLFFSIPGFKRGFDEIHNPARRLFTLTTDNDQD